RPLTEVDSTLDKQLILLAAIGAAGIALAGLIGAIVARTALAPVTRFTRRTEALATDIDLSQRLEVGGRDELARLARSFNQTLDAVRVDAIVRDQVERAERRWTGLTFAARLEPVLVQGEPERINRAVSNLLDNARKWSPPDGTVDVELDG